ncbi:MAG TPA: AI-2E family transporter [Terriglobales bacterium]|nr:AI-2E family transporter [Terriglobales bacterium]
MSGKNATLVFLAVLLVVSFALAYFVARPFIKPVAFAIIIAVVFNPLYERILKAVKGRGRASLLTILLVILLFAIPLTFVLITASRQALEIAHYFSQRSAAQGGFVPSIMNLAERHLGFVTRHFDLSSVNLRQQIASHLNQIGLSLLGSGAALLGNFVGLITDSVIALITAFFLFRDGERVVKKISGVLPLSAAQVHRLLNGVTDAIVANVYGMAAVGAAQGLLTAIGLTICSVPSATLLGLLAAVCSLVPIVGAGLVWGPAGIYLIVIGHVAKGIFLLIWGTVVISSIDNIIRPLVVQGRVQAHPLLLLFALIGGAQAFGLLGIFLGPVLLSVISVLLTIVFEETRGVPSESSRVATLSE